MLARLSVVWVHSGQVRNRGPQTPRGAHAQGPSTVRGPRRRRRHRWVGSRRRLIRWPC